MKSVPELLINGYHIVSIDSFSWLCYIKHHYYYRYMNVLQSLIHKKISDPIVVVLF